ncbi:hypothetical protein ACLOJK_031080 [Asimina triloba]
MQVKLSRKGNIQGGDLHLADSLSGGVLTEGLSGIMMRSQISTLGVVRPTKPNTRPSEGWTYVVAGDSEICRVKYVSIWRVGICRG